VLRVEVVSNPFENVLQVLPVYPALFGVHVEYLQECLSLGRLQLEMVGGYFAVGVGVLHLGGLVWEGWDG